MISDTHQSRLASQYHIPFQHHGVKLPNFARCNRPPSAAFKFYHLADTVFLWQQAAAHYDASLRLRCTWRSQFFFFKSLQMTKEPRHGMPRPSIFVNPPIPLAPTTCSLAPLRNRVFCHGRLCITSFCRNVADRNGENGIAMEYDIQGSKNYISSVITTPLVSLLVASTMRSASTK
ncbi:hypothetical protein D9619_005180 [Psilocybe cf. subviscida]|uniref:Uncharacterized protein n=1 Tax=Psilocybe cf. subviscida TaxID=2480587 RepID=A0A8H5BWF3_9AGAR|nr:hypothetical protein D9619_005180 [Psilocybe cf. subviscida]